MKNTTLVYLIKEHEQKVLLARKNRGLGEGVWNGAGGKIEDGEDARTTSVREALEELQVSINPADLIEVANLTFTIEGYGSWHNTTFFTRRWQGTPTATEEMGEPTWFSFNALPLEHMWQSDHLWLPHTLNGQHIEGEFWFDADGKTLIRHTVHCIK